MTDKVTTVFERGLSQARIEEALDKRELYGEISNGRWWQVRRNGRTQTWKTRPGDFRIPIKYGLKGTAEVTHINLAHFALREDVPAGMRPS